MLDHQGAGPKARATHSVEYAYFAFYPSSFSNLVTPGTGFGSHLNITQFCSASSSFFLLCLPFSKSDFRSSSVLKSLCNALLLLVCFLVFGGRLLGCLLPDKFSSEFVGLIESVGPQLDPSWCFRGYTQCTLKYRRLAFSTVGSFKRFGLTLKSLGKCNFRPRLH